MTESTLKPCPYCTSAHVKAVRMEFGKFYAVVCRDCGSTGPLVALTAYWLSFEYHDAAVKKWNDRQLTEDDVVEIRINGAEFMDNVRAAAEALSEAGDDEKDIRYAGSPGEEADKEILAQEAEPDTPEPPTVPATAASDKSQALSSGGKLDTPQQRLIRFFNRPDISTRSAEKAIGISHQTLANIKNGKGASAATIEKLITALDRFEADEQKDPELTHKPPPPIAPPKLNGIKNPKQAAKFFSKAVSDWIETEGLDPVTAAEILEVNNQVLSNIRNHKNGHLPHRNVINKFAKTIPAIRAKLAVLNAHKRAMEKVG